MSKDSWDNYKGLQVPPKHGDLFRAMDQQERFYAEIMKMNEVSIQNAFNQAKPKVIAELNAIKNNHLIVFNSKVLNEILSKIQIGNSSDTDFLSKGDIAVDLSSYYLLGNSEIFKSIKLQIPHFFKDYKDIYNGIITPFNKVIDDLLKTTSQVELHSIKNDFLQNLNHLNTYFEYSEGNNYQSPILEIKCKESLIQIVEDIGLKIDDFNEAQNELQRLIDEDNSNLNLPIIPPLVLNQSQPNQPIVNEQPLTELERALAEIKALKEVNAVKDTKIKELEEQNKKELLDFLNKKENDLKAKDLIISNLSENNNELKTHIEETREDKKELRIEKNEWKAKYEAKDESLQKTIEELIIEKAKVSELTQKIGVHNHDGSSSWIQLEQEEISNLGEGALENQNSD